MWYRKLPTGDTAAVLPVTFHLGLLADAARRARMGAAARRLCLARFDAGACAAAHLALYEELAAARRTAR